MATPGDYVGPSSADGSSPDVRPELAGLAEQMRGTVTPIVGYLELISQDVNGLPPQHYLHWISTIERRLEAVRETSDQISRICDVLRQSINDPEASTSRAPEAPED
jgi:hypothetical protein